MFAGAIGHLALRAPRGYILCAIRVKDFEPNASVFSKGNQRRLKERDILVALVWVVCRVFRMAHYQPVSGVRVIQRNSDLERRSHASGDSWRIPRLLPSIESYSAPALSKEIREHDGVTLRPFRIVIVTTLYQAALDDAVLEFIEPDPEIFVPRANFIPSAGDLGYIVASFPVQPFGMDGV